MARDAAPRPTRGRWLRERPWIWVLFLFVLVLGVNLLVVWIAGQQPPEPAP